MKVIIAGSRDITDYNIVYEAVNNSGVAPYITEIVSGGARGVDKLGELYAKNNNIPVKIFLADWNTYNKSAGYKRNLEMGNYADYLIAVWNGESKGTKHMIDIMLKLNKGRYIHGV